MTVRSAVMGMARCMPVPGSGVVVAPPAPVAAFVVVVVTGVAAVQLGRFIWLLSRVTAPLRARSLPNMTAPVVAVTEVNASTVPTKTELVPSVAELVTCQNTLHALPPLITVTLLDEAVISVLAL
jgi:hypothetical protein